VTLNVRIKNLIEKGHIKLVPDQTDRRIKYAVPSEKTIDYIEALSSYIGQITIKK
jgi:DNA-binding MarR family transcriptional regulator